MGCLSGKKPGCIVIVNVPIRDDMRDEWRAFAKNDPAGLAKLTRPYKGCLSMTYTINDETNVITLVENWTDRAAFDAYLQYRKENGMQGLVEKFATGPPQFTFLNPDHGV